MDRQEVEAAAAKHGLRVTGTFPRHTSIGEYTLEHRLSDPMSIARDADGLCLGAGTLDEGLGAIALRARYDIRRFASAFSDPAAELARIMENTDD